MHVAYIGNFEPPHSTENDVKSALEALGHQVTPLQEQHVNWPALVTETILAIPDVDLVLWTRTGSLDVTPADVQRHCLGLLRDARIPTAGFHLDRYWGLTARSDREEWVRTLPYFQDTDFMFTADGGNAEKWADAGVNHHWLPPGVAGKNIETVGKRNAKFRAEIGFVGSWRDYHPEWPERKRLVSLVQNRYRRRFKAWEGHIRGQDLADLYATVPILIGDSCMIGDGGYYWSDRIPETLGRGGFLLHPDTPGLRDHFPEGTLVTWEQGKFGELRDHIDYYLRQHEERETIAAAGQQHVAEYHTYERRMEQVFEIVGVKTD
ncbi:MAG: glycosyltransferase family 1 protein [bacterium]|nr:glycosyltransferase family 1 protein [bacterium]